MKMDPNCKIHEIAGGTIVVKQGAANVNMTRIISLDASARRLYQTLVEQDFTVGGRKSAGRYLLD